MENLNPDLTLTGRCKCGATQKSYGMRWMIEKEETVLAHRYPVLPEFDKSIILWYNKKR